jgi:hypothetical protein
MPGRTAVLFMAIYVPTLRKDISAKIELKKYQCTHTALSGICGKCRSFCAFLDNFEFPTRADHVKSHHNRDQLRSGRQWYSFSVKRRTISGEKFSGARSKPD